MKFLLLCFSAFVLALPTVAQNLPLRKLLKFRELGVSELNQKLEKKDWTLVSNSQPTQGVMGKAVWAYKPSEEGAVAWLILYYNTNSPSRILYNIYQGNAFDKVKRKILRQKFASIAEGNTIEGLDNLESYTDYAAACCVLRLITYKQDGYNGIKLFDKQDYMTAKKNGRL